MDLTKVALTVFSGSGMSLSNKIVVNMAVVRAMAKAAGVDPDDVFVSMLNDESGEKPIQGAIKDVVSDIEDGLVTPDDVNEFISGIEAKTHDVQSLEDAVTGAHPDDPKLLSVVGLAGAAVEHLKDPRNGLVRTSSSPLSDRPDYGDGGASVPRGDRTSVKKQKYNKNTDQVEWAYTDKKGKKVLEWFGKNPPSPERLEKAKKRVQWFSTGPGKKKSSVNTIAARVAGV